MLRLKRFSQTRHLNTSLSGIGFERGRKYDQDLGRLGRMNTAQRELQKTDDLRIEIGKLGKELKNSKQQWQDTD